MNPEAISTGLQVRWFARAKPAGWHYGTVVRVLARGRNKGLVEVLGADGRHLVAPASLNPHITGGTHA